MHTLVLSSASGGVGTTSLTSVLGLLLRQGGQRTLLLEFNPANQLDIHVAVDSSSPHGVAQCAEPEALSRHVHLSPEGQSYIPFGQPTADALVRFESHLVTHPGWLACGLHALAQDPIWADAWVLIDTPPLPSLYARQALQLDAQAWVILRPDAPNLLQLPRITTACQHPGLSWRVLLNAVDPTHVLHLDVHTLAKSRLGARLLPRWVHRDQAMAEAVAAGTTLTDYAPHSQALEDLQALANLLLLEGMA